MFVLVWAFLLLTNALVVLGGGLQPYQIQSAAIISFGLLAARLMLVFRNGLPVHHERILWVIAALLFALGGLSTYNADHSYSLGEGKPSFASVPSLKFLPSATDQNVGKASLQQLFTPLVFCLGAASIAGSMHHRRILIIGLAIIGFIFATIGLLMKAIDSRLVVHQANPDSPFSFFGFHGYAGSFLIATTMMSFASSLWIARLIQQRKLKFLVVSGATGISVLGLFVNESEGAVLIGFLLGLIAASVTLFHRFSTELSRSADHSARKLAGYVPFLIIPFLGLGVVSGGISQLYAWATSGGLHGRSLMWKSAAGLASDAGWFGFGPGSYKLLLPQSHHLAEGLTRNWILTKYEPGTAVSYWCHACNDPLQTVVEWGWVGACLWIVFVTVPAIRLFRIALAGGPDAVLAGGGQPHYSD